MKLSTAAAESLRCPEWCVEDHDGDDPADCFHRSDITAVETPADSAPKPKSRLLMTHLVMHSVSPAESCIAIGDTYGGFDLTTPEQADAYLANLTDHLFQVRALRDRLAEIQRQ